MPPSPPGSAPDIGVGSNLGGPLPRGIWPLYGRGVVAVSTPTILTAFYIMTRPNCGRCHIEYGPPWIWTRGPYSIGEYGPGGPYSPVKYGPPMENGPHSIPTLILLHITLILLRMMYIAFPNLKHCKNKCLPVFLKIKKKNGPIQKHIYEVWTSH